MVPVDEVIPGVPTPGVLTPVDLNVDENMDERYSTRKRKRRTPVNKWEADDCTQIENYSRMVASTNDIVKPVAEYAPVMIDLN